MGLCKLCLLDSTNYIDIFGEKGIVLNIESILSQHFWFDISRYDTVSTIICDKCWDHTESFNKFYVNIQDAHKNCMDNTRTIIKNESKEEVFIDIDPILFEQKVEGTSDNEDDTSIKNEKVEEEFSSDDNHIEQTDTESSESNSSEYDEPVAKKRVKRKVISKSKPKKEIKRTEETSSDKEEESDDDELENDNDDDYDKKKKKKKTITNPPKPIRLKEDAQIREFCQMNCEICGILLKSLLDAQKHYKKKHDTKGYLVCCNEKQFQRCKLLDHIAAGHIDPNAFRCDICKRMLSSKSSFKKHMDTHVTVDDRPFKCDLCSASFTRKFRLNKHKLIKHCSEEDKKFTCTHCPKVFMTQGQLNSHIKYVTEEERFICEFCAKKFRNTQHLNAHRGTEHLGETVPKLQCSICGSWLTGKISLRIHMRRHKDTTQTCTICAKVFNNKNTLGNHMRNVHGGRVYQCLLCDKGYRKATSLREHMAYHTGQDLYTCPYCPKTFKSSGNMHAHRKREHYLDWERDRGKRFVNNTY